MSSEIDATAQRYLLRKDKQEDVCFALWHPSQGKSRDSALISKLILPASGDRHVHGNASFESTFFERALDVAMSEQAGLALLHSHPGGQGWQDMSQDDIHAEQGHAPAVFGATKRPFVGLTMAGQGEWSARFWEHDTGRVYFRVPCSSVRVVGERMKTYYNNALRPIPRPMLSQTRTISSWGEECQQDLVRLKVGVIGIGSVGGIVAEALARTGFQKILLIDFDKVEECNLDRLQYASKKDIGHYKIDVLAQRLKEIATANNFQVETIRNAVYEEKGFRAALDCDIIFSCVDRPWGRYVLNLIAYAHLIPVFDGGIAVALNKNGKLRKADWRAHTATPGRACLECLGQYTPSDVSLEREGFLDDPSYIEGLPKDNILKASENVYAFALACGSLQVLQMLSYTIAPLGISDPGQQLYHFVDGKLEDESHETCKGDCLFPSLIALGDDCNMSVAVQKEDMPPTKIAWKDRLYKLIGRFCKGRVSKRRNP